MTFVPMQGPPLSVQANEIDKPITLCRLLDDAFTKLTAPERRVLALILSSVPK